MGKSTISMAMFNSYGYVCLPKGMWISCLSTLCETWGCGSPCSVLQTVLTAVACHQRLPEGLSHWNQPRNIDIAGILYRFFLGFENFSDHLGWGIYGWFNFWMFLSSSTFLNSGCITLYNSITIPSPSIHLFRRQGASDPGATSPALPQGAQIGRLPRRQRWRRSSAKTATAWIKGWMILPSGKLT